MNPGVVILFLGISLVGGNFLKPADNNYYVVVDYVRTCKVDVPQTLFINHRRYNKTMFATSMNLTLTEPLGNNFQLEFKFYKWGDSGWKKLIDVRKDDACEGLYLLLGPSWVYLVKVSNGNVGCPINPGVYHANDFSQHNAGTKVAPFIVWPGRFRGTFEVFKHKTKTICIEFQMVVQNCYTDCSQGQGRV